MARVSAQVWNLYIDTLYSGVDELRAEYERLLIIVEDIRLWNNDRMIHVRDIPTVAKWNGEAMFYLAGWVARTRLQPKAMLLQRRSSATPEPPELSISDKQEIISLMTKQLEDIYTFSGKHKLIDLKKRISAAVTLVEDVRAFIAVCRRAGYGI